MQNNLEEAYVTYHDAGLPVTACLTPEPDNETDSSALLVQLDYGKGLKTCGVYCKRNDTISSSFTNLKCLSHCSCNAYKIWDIKIATWLVYGLVTKQGLWIKWYRQLVKKYIDCFKLCSRKGILQSCKHVIYIA